MVPFFPHETTVSRFEFQVSRLKILPGASEAVFIELVRNDAAVTQNLKLET
jgi:hypothetical protein